MDARDQNLLPRGCFYHRLQSGLEIIGQYLPGRKSVVCGCHINIGIAREPEEKQGLTAILKQLCSQSGAEMKKEEIDEYAGIHLEISTEPERMLVLTQSVETKLASSLGLLKAVLQAPMSPAVRLKELRLIVKQQIIRRRANPVSRLMDAAGATFFRGTTLARSPLGTLEGVERIELPDIHTFWKQYYQPDNLFFAVAGSFVWDEVVEQLQALFEDWRGHVLPLQPQCPSPVRNMVAIRQASQQEHLCFMFPFPHYASADSYAAMLLRGVLMQRLFEALRGRHNLVYRITVDFISTQCSGYMRIYIGTLPEYTGECVRVVYDEIQHLEQENLSADALALAKVKMKSENVFWSENTKNRFTSITRSWWHERNFRTIDDIKQAVDAVTAEQIHKILQRFLPSSTLTLAALGPVEPEVALRCMAQ
jgi:predicted Zn-dependent peptidase